MKLESKLGVNRKFLYFLSFVLLCTSGLWANSQWVALGPDGGDVRSLTADPQNPDHIFLGTSTGTIFVSSDGGHNWSRLAHLGNGDDYVVDHIAIDPHHPKHMYAAVWSVENQQAGDLFHSKNGGESWEIVPDMHNKSIRAMAMAAYDSKTMVAGALDGVFRSTDGGDTWQKISSSNPEIHNIESIAVDPKDPNVVYAGTWHLAWKTSDGGASWHHINKGMVDDSDVFSIIVDSSNASVVFASACSGIYKSQNAGEMFQKIQGIPFSARRTRVLKQDPSNPAMVYAGTTEGLWKTVDSGKTWNRVSSPEVVVNDVLIDSRNSQRVLLATDRSGVLASDDGAQTFAASNHGYTHRYVTAVLTDKKHSDTIYVGVVNDREMGGVFVSHDDGQHWAQQSKGLDGRDVFALAETNKGEIVAGTNRGMFVLAAGASEWSPINNIVQASAHHSRTAHPQRSILTARVNSIAITPTRWLAATSAGLYMSSNEGKSWSGGPVMGKQDFVSIHEDAKILVLASRSNVLVSKDNGAIWKEASFSSSTNGIRSLVITPDGQIVLASREGAFRSPNAGAGWEHITNGLPDKNISSITYDESGKRLLATSTETGVVFESEDSGSSWHRGPDAGYTLRSVSLFHGRLLAVTSFDGVVMQPESEQQAEMNEGHETNK